MKIIIILALAALIIGIIFSQKSMAANRKRTVEKKAKRMGYDLHFDDKVPPRE